MLQTSLGNFRGLIESLTKNKFVANSRAAPLVMFLG